MTKTGIDLLEDAITQRVIDGEEGLDELEARAGEAADEKAGWADTERHALSRWGETLREILELARCLRRLVRGRTQRQLHEAFGEPNGYTAVGLALTALYGEPAPAPTEMGPMPETPVPWKSELDWTLEIRGSSGQLVGKLVLANLVVDGAPQQRIGPGNAAALLHRVNGWPALVRERDEAVEAQLAAERRVAEVERRMIEMSAERLERATADAAGTADTEAAAIAATAAKLEAVWDVLGFNGPYSVFDVLHTFVVALAAGHEEVVGNALDAARVLLRRRQEYADRLGVQGTEILVSLGAAEIDMKPPAAKEPQGG